MWKKLMENVDNESTSFLDHVVHVLTVNANLMRGCLDHVFL